MSADHWGHPFWVADKGWTSARDLCAGDEVVLQSGDVGVVTSVEGESLGEPVAVYNLEVEDWHTYYVGDAGLLVHNLCDPTGSGHGPNQHHKDTINAEIKKLSEEADVTNVYANRALNTAGLKGTERPDIIIERIVNGKKTYTVIEYASPSQAPGAPGYDAWRQKIKTMEKANPNVRFFAYDWGTY